MYFEVDIQDVSVGSYAAFWLLNEGCARKVEK